ncbi:hypothetical protein PROFUN_00604 [Planoprotostelium fungivorum]|uniref:WH1 domain-containing protein n=1 Tax=Planoprotostelium fungivorum TaxID=1890364 RepID=A0A2P6NTU0_9EUKA|nr:hypothetical protein PROFUN_00604 [Planoprotostelium fungivorum]
MSVFVSGHVLLTSNLMLSELELFIVITVCVYLSEMTEPASKGDTPRMVYEATVSVFVMRENTKKPDPDWSPADGGISTLALYQSQKRPTRTRLVAKPSSNPTMQTILSFWIEQDAFEQQRNTPRFLQMKAMSDGPWFGLSFKFANDTDDFLEIIKALGKIQNEVVSIDHKSICRGNHPTNNCIRGYFRTVER